MERVEQGELSVVGGKGHLTCGIGSSRKKWSLIPYSMSSPCLFNDNFYHSFCLFMYLYPALLQKGFKVDRKFDSELPTNLYKKGNVISYMIPCLGDKNKTKENKKQMCKRGPMTSGTETRENSPPGP